MQNLYEYVLHRRPSEYGKYIDLQRATSKIRDYVDFFFYVKTRTFSLIISEMPTSYFFGKSTTKSHRLFEKYATPLKTPYKYTKTIILLAAHKKQQFL